MATKTTEYVGVPGLNRTLGKLPKEASTELRDASVSIAELVAAGARARAYQAGGVLFLVAPTIVPKRDRVPKVSMGSASKLPTSTSVGYHTRSGPNQTIGNVIWGGEFGGGKRPNTRQFMPHRGTIGYALWPEVRAQSDDIERKYSEALHDALVQI